MQIANRLAGFSLGGRGFAPPRYGEEKSEDMDAQRENFLTGCLARKVPRKRPKKFSI